MVSTRRQVSRGSSASFAPVLPLDPVDQYHPPGRLSSVDELLRSDSSRNFLREPNHPLRTENEWLGSDGGRRLESEFGRHAPMSALPQRCVDPPQSSPASAADVERFSGRYRLQQAQVNELHEFNQHSTPTQMVELFALLLRNQADLISLKASLGSVETKADDLLSRFAESFQPSRQDVATMRKITRHYAVQPLRRYMMLSNHVSTYLQARPTMLNTPLYPSNASVKKTIHKLLQEYAGQARAAIRKLVWRFTLNRTTLQDWVNFMNLHYVSGRPEQSTKCRARLALMRRVAQPLVERPTMKGQNTGFWIKLQKVLDELYKRHGEDLECDAWNQWAETIIAEDEAEYKDPIVELNENEDDDECLGNDE